MSSETTQHTSVLLNEVVEYLSSNGSTQRVMVDCTLGGGGHAEHLLTADDSLFLIGIDRDTAALARCAERLAQFTPRCVLLQGNFADVTDILAEAGPQIEEKLAALSFETSYPQVDALLADLGLSSDQLNDPERGFSFSSDAPLDMRMDKEQQLSADFVVNSYSVAKLRSVFRQGGVGPASDRLAKAIVDARPITTTASLAAITRQAMLEAKRSTQKGGSSSHNLATVPFQAIRMEVNKELDAIDSLLVAVRNLLAPGGRAAIISFHSLEDKAVARAFRAWSAPDEVLLRSGRTGSRGELGKHLTQKAVVPGEKECGENPRARSARLRVFEMGSLGQ